MHNGIDHGIFLKPDALSSNTLTWQEYYEADEILKVRELTALFVFAYLELLFVIQLSFGLIASTVITKEGRR